MLNGLAKYLSDSNILDENEILEILDSANKKNISFISYLLIYSSLDSALLAKSISCFFKLPQIALDEKDINTFPIDAIDKEIILKYKILPFAKEDSQLFIALPNPTEVEILNEIKFYSDLKLKLFVADYNLLKDLIDKVLNVKEYSEADRNEDIPIIKFVNHVLDDAIKQGASDIHFEPYEKKYRIRFRIDGILYEITNPAYNLIDRIVTRLKIISGLDIAERRLPQDGRFSISLKEKRDLRVSTCPTLYGEKIVVRILNPKSTILQLDNLGLDEKQLALFLSNIRRPQGMVLVTGPTGSGKTVTLYSALCELNSSSKNIVTAEDPIEINLPGINQVQINSKIGLYFSTCLRTFLRQDPDIIMLGEIRDLETAEIAVKAAQTGHLVFSTLHTNSALATIARLINMGIPSFNVKGSVNLIIAQRLLRRLCPYCKKRDSISKKMLSEQGFLENELDSFPIYKPVGCKKCKDGYQGRIGVFEFLPIFESIQFEKIKFYNNKQYIYGLKQSALNKVKVGITSFEEISRII